MSEQPVNQICFDFLPRLPIVVEPKEVDVSSDAGILPLRQFDDQIGSTRRFIACLEDSRDPHQTEHTFAEMVRQRIFGILAGYEVCYDNYTERGESENRHKELKDGFAGDRLSCHRFLANYFRLQLHVAGLNLLIRLRPMIADPPALRAWDEYDPDYERVPVKDPTVPAEALTGEERRRYQNYRRRKDPLGRGQIETWRTMLIKVAGEVTQSVRRILITIPTHWPHLEWFRHVCQRIAAISGSAQAPI